MKWIKSNTAQDMFALWLGYLLFLIMMHFIEPDDPWNQMFYRPVFLIFAPLLVACVPLLATKPDAATDGGDGERSWNPASRKTQRDPDMVRKALLVWLVSLVVFGSPLRPRYHNLAPIVHQPLFLLIAPLLLAGISLFIPWTVPIRSATIQKAPTLSRSKAWSTLISAIILLPILIGVLVLINSPSMQGSRSPLLLDLFFVVFVIGDLWVIRRCVKALIHRS